MTEGTWTLTERQNCQPPGYAYEIHARADSGARWPVALVVNGEDAQLLQAAPLLLSALQLCATRIFNYQAGMDRIRDPQATEELNGEAWEAAIAAIRAAGAYGRR